MPGKGGGKSSKTTLHIGSDKGGEISTREGDLYAAKRCYHVHSYLLERGAISKEKKTTYDEEKGALDHIPSFAAIGGSALLERGKKKRTYDRVVKGELYGAGFL